MRADIAVFFAFPVPDEQILEGLLDSFLLVLGLGWQFTQMFFYCFVVMHIFEFQVGHEWVEVGAETDLLQIEGGFAEIGFMDWVWFFGLGLAYSGVDELVYLGY